MPQVHPAPDWRLTFDVPHSFALEPAFFKATYCHDFDDKVDSLTNCWRDPLTGIVLLEPSFVSVGYAQSGAWSKLSDWSHDAAYWKDVFDGPDATIADGVARFWASVMSITGGSLPDFSANTLAASLSTFIALPSLPGVSAADKLVWAMQSTFNMARDEAFALHYQNSAKPKTYQKNWIGVQVDDLLFHFSLDGTLRTYQYKTALTTMPVLIDQAVIAGPHDFLKGEGYLIFLPIPGFGMGVYHAESGQKMATQFSSGQASAKRAHLVPIVRSDGSGLYVHKGLKVAKAVNPGLSVMAYKFGFHRVRFPASGVFVGEVIDPGFIFSHSPDNIAALVVADQALSSAVTSAVSTLVKADGVSGWAAGVDRQGRISVALASTDTIHTPFLYGTFIAWTAHQLERTTTPVGVDFNHLEWTFHDTGQVEGMASVITHDPALIAIIDRGDTTWLLERTDDPGAVLPLWVTEAGGLAKIADEVQVYEDGAGVVFYDATWILHGLEARFDEIGQVFDAAFDNLTVGQSVNNTLAGSGFPYLASIPAEASAVRLPPLPPGQHWRYAPRRGDRGDEIIRDLLLFLRRQWQEFRMRYDWDIRRWNLEKKLRDTSEGATWHLTPYAEEESLVNRYIGIMAPVDGGLARPYTFLPVPPEGNVIQPFGLSTADHDGDRVPGRVLVNVPSIYDPTSIDYLGRAVPIYPMMAPLSDTASDQVEINVMGRRVYDAASHHRTKLNAMGSEYIKNLLPGPTRVKCRLRDASGVIRDRWDLWLRRKTTVIDADRQVTALYALDSVWETEIEGVKN